MSKYFLGIDGGGTKTEYLVIDENDNIVYQAFSKGSSIHSRSFDDIKLMLNEEISKIPYKLESIFLGIGDISSKEDEKLVVDAIEYNCLKTAKNDAYNALAGALDLKDGIIVISGTGSACFGKNKDKTHRCGGYSYIENDFGSAYYLGIESLRYLAKVIDGRMIESDFSKALKEYTKIYDFPTLVNCFNENSRDKIANIAKVVTSSSDINAKQIMEKSAKELFLMIKTVYEKLEFTDGCYFSIIGSCGNFKSYFQDVLFSLISSELPKIKIIKKINEASFGSAKLAKKVYFDIYN